MESDLSRESSSSPIGRIHLLMKTRKMEPLLKKKHDEPVEQRLDRLEHMLWCQRVLSENKIQKQKEKIKKLVRIIGRLQREVDQLHEMAMSDHRRARVLGSAGAAFLNLFQPGKEKEEKDEAEEKKE